MLLWRSLIADSAVLPAIEMVSFERYRLTTEATPVATSGRLVQPGASTGRRHRSVRASAARWAPAGCDHPLVTEYAREIPLLFGGRGRAAFERFARFGDGRVTAAPPPAMVAPTLESVRTTWKGAERDGLEPGVGRVFCVGRRRCRA